MFLGERYEKILKLLEKEGRVKVKELAKTFEVTEYCIRKDLKELENQDKLKRVYGGAIINRNHVDIKSIDEKQTINHTQKGGEFNKEVGAVVGSAANLYISSFTFDKAFIGVCGVNIENETLSTVNIEDGSTKKTIIENSNRSYIVMENEKLNYDEFYKFATLKDIDAIISEKEIIHTPIKEKTI